MVNTQIKAKKAVKNVSILPIDYKNSISDAIINHILEQGNSLDSLRASLQSIYSKGVSKSYLSNIKNKQFIVGKTQISDNDFLLLGDFFKIHFEKKIWKTVETDSFLDCFETFRKAKRVRLPISLYGDTGTGKSIAATSYVQENSKDSFYTRCEQVFTKKEFVEELCKSANVSYQSSSARSMAAIARKMRGIQRPLFIIDEAEHLNLSKFNLLKSLYDATEGRLGLVLIMATDDFKRFSKKAQKGIGTFPQIFSRLAGTSHVTMNFNLAKDLPFICKELGISNSDWFTNKAYKWLIDKGDIKEYRTLRNYIEFAYTEFEESGNPITWDDMEYLFPSNDKISF